MCIRDRIHIYPKSMLETVWQQDKLLFTPEAEQPPLCLRCGQPLDVYKRQTQDAGSLQRCNRLCLAGWHMAASGGYQQRVPALCPIQIQGDVYKRQLINTLKDIAAALSRPAPSAISFPADRKSTRLNSSHVKRSRMPSSA